VIILGILSNSSMLNNTCLSFLITLLKQAQLSQDDLNIQIDAATRFSEWLFCLLFYSRNCDVTTLLCIIWSCPIWVWHTSCAASPQDWSGFRLQKVSVCPLQHCPFSSQNYLSCMKIIH